MTKEEIINQYTPLDHPANKGKEFSVIRYKHLYKAMDEWAAMQNNVLIGVLKKIKAALNDPITSEYQTLNEVNQINNAALASYAEQAPPEKSENAITAFQKRFVVEHIPEYMQENFRFFSEGFKAAGGGQVTGKSAGVWVDEDDHYPYKDGAYVVKFSNGEKRIEKFSDGYWVSAQMSQRERYCFQWLDESGEAGKQPEQAELLCMVCGKAFMGELPQMCCSGQDCGCLGMPAEPIVCSKECYDNLPHNISKRQAQKESKLPEQQPAVVSPDSDALASQTSISWFP